MTLDEEDDVERSVTAIKYSYSRVTFNVFREDENFNFSVSIWELVSFSQRRPRGLVSKETVVLRWWDVKHKILDLSTELIR